MNSTERLTTTALALLLGLQATPGSGQGVALEEDGVHIQDPGGTTSASLTPGFLNLGSPGGLHGYLQIQTNSGNLLMQASSGSFETKIFGEIQLFEPFSVSLTDYSMALDGGTGDITTIGEVSAASFAGDGSQLTGVGTTADLGALARCLDGNVGGWRYWDLGDGTVLDCNTGKMWLQDATCLGTGPWGDTVTPGTVQNKIFFLNNGTDFGCAGYPAGRYNDWQLPSMEDLCGLWNATCWGSTNCCTESQGIVDTNFAAPAVADSSGSSRWTSGDPFVGVQLQPYWSASEFDANTAFVANLDDGFVGNDFKSRAFYGWAVRSDP